MRAWFSDRYIERLKVGEARGSLRLVSGARGLYRDVLAESGLWDFRSDKVSKDG